MRRPAGDVDRAAGRHQRLADHLAAEHALPADLRRAAAEQVDLELLEVEDVQQVLNGGRTWKLFRRACYLQRGRDWMPACRSGLTML